MEREGGEREERDREGREGRWREAGERKDGEEGWRKEGRLGPVSHYPNFIIFHPYVGKLCVSAVRMGCKVCVLSPMGEGPDPWIGVNRAT